MSYNAPQPSTAGHAASDRDAQFQADAERHRLIKERAEGDAAYDGSDPAPSWLARLKRQFGSRHTDG